MTLASFNGRDDTITWLGVGNVEGVLLRADSATPDRASVLLRSGVVGYRLPPLHSSVLRVNRGDVAVFASDGVRSGFGEDLSLEEPPQRLADRIVATFRKGTDDAVVLVVRYLGSAR